jgi:cob(I)alamin adenosyltransferase
METELSQSLNNNQKRKLLDKKHTLTRIQQNLQEKTNDLSRFEEYNKSTKTNENKIEKLSKPIDNIRAEIETLLNEINTCIQKDFIYSQILRIIIKFIILL